MRRKKLLIVSAIFPPIQSSGIHRIVRITRYLVEMGVQVSVLTVDEKTLARSFKYDTGLLEKVPAGVKIYRVPAIQVLKKAIEWKSRGKRGKEGEVRRPSPVREPRKSKKGAAQAVKDFVTLNLQTPDNYAFWIRPAIRSGQEILRSEGIRNIFSSSPPGSSHVVCYHLKCRTGATWIADFRDPWAAKSWHNPEMTAYKRWRIRQYERKTVEMADTLVMNTPELLSAFRDHYGAEIEAKARVITNGYDPSDFIDLPEISPPATGQIVICHAGTFYRQRSPMYFLQGLGQAIADGQVPADRFKVRLIGGAGHFREEVERFLGEHNLQHCVEIIPPVPHRACLAECRAADVLLIVQPVTPVQVPAKIFEYIALGKPVLAISAEGATANLVLENKLGWWARYDSQSDIAARLGEIHRFFASGAAQGWQVNPAVREKYDGRKLSQQLYEHLIA